MARDGLPHLQRWMAAMASRSACQAGILVPPRATTSAEQIAAAQAILQR